MKATLSLVCFLFSILVFSQDLPKTTKKPIPFSKHDFSFQDDYSWLENIHSEETNTWVDAENEVTYKHFEEIKKKYSPLSKIKEYDFLSTNGLPTKKGKYFYSFYRKDKTQPSSLFFRKNLLDQPREIINPYKIYSSNTVSVAGYYPSKSSSLLAYKLSLNGSDVQEIRFADLTKFRDLDDVLENVKFSHVAWNSDKGIFYKKTSNTNALAKDSTYQLFYHPIGVEQTNDQLIFDSSKRESDFTFRTIDNKLFIMETSKDETSRDFYQASLSTEPFVLEKIIENDLSDFKMISYFDNRIYFSSKKYDWGEIRSFDVQNKADETVIVPQIYNNLLVGSYFYDNYILCKYKTLGKNYLTVYDNKGQFIRKFDAPPGMDFSIKFFNKETKDLFVSFYSYTTSFQNYKLNLETGNADPYFNDYIKPKPTVFPIDYFETKLITYKSRDNKDIPITIVYKKGMVLDGNNPTLLSAYGGFGNISGPRYDTGLLYFLEKGGVYAYAEIRGGGEKGLKWHTEGKGLKKMNTFNDFIDAAEFLIREKYTSPNKLAITGASQGGLLVGVAMTQRPELFKVVVPKVGIYDMAKFGDYTAGKFWKDEYGNVENKQEFEALIKYSPYHNIKEDVNYPITLIITSENDDRVVPLHSYKFAAKLQNRAAQKNPIYLRTSKKSGHYGKNSNYNDAVEETADFYSFLLYHLN